MSADEVAACPYCHREVTLAALFTSAEAQRAFARLVVLSVPLGNRVMRYVTLFTPPKTRLTQAKQLKLIEQLLPDLERGAITINGTELAAPLPLWNLAFERLFSVADNGRLTLPLRGHGYLHSTMQDLALAEAQKPSEPAKRAPQRAAAPAMYGEKDPALADMDARSAQAAKPSAEIRAQIARITGKEGKE